jgi:hypothetical protein
MEESVSLTEAALALRMTYPAALNAVLRGDLQGWKDERRRWRVRKADVLRLASNVRDSSLNP